MDTVEPNRDVDVTLHVNGDVVHRTVEARRLLVDFLREDLRLTGTHIGCEHGVCGACTVLLNGLAVRSCIMLAVQADGCRIRTVEGLSSGDELTPMQQSFKDNHALQCGFCTPGLLMTLAGARSDVVPSDEAIRELLSGNICRCTGYENIVAAVRLAWLADHEGVHVEGQVRPSSTAATHGA